MSTQFLSVLSTRFLRGFLSERDLRHFCTKTRSFLEKWLDSFLCTWNMSTRFLNSEKIWVLVSYKAVSYKKKCVLVYWQHLGEFWIAHHSAVNRCMGLDGKVVLSFITLTTSVEGWLDFGLGASCCLLELNIFRILGNIGSLETFSDILFSGWVGIESWAPVMRQTFRFSDLGNFAGLFWLRMLHWFRRDTVIRVAINCRIVLNSGALFTIVDIAWTFFITNFIGINFKWIV